MLIHETIERLRSIDSDYFGENVAGAIDYFTAKTGGCLKAPAIYVIEGAQQVVGNPLGDAQSPKQVNWRHTFMLSVIAKPPCHDEDMTQKWASDAVAPIRNIIFDALVGWTPDNLCFSPITPVSVLIGEGGEDGVEIMFTFTTQEMIAVPENQETEIDCDTLARFGVAMNGFEAVIDPCEKAPDCDIKKIESDAGGDNQPCN